MLWCVKEGVVGMDLETGGLLLLTVCVRLARKALIRPSAWAVSSLSLDIALCQWFPASFHHGEKAWREPQSRQSVP